MAWVRITQVTSSRIDMPLNLPNVLTWLRILLIPLVVAVFYLPRSWIGPQQADFFAALMFSLAAVTDWLDGYLARVLDQTSAFGAFLDPVADKLMVASALIVLVQLGRVDALVALIIIGREITISALREWMASIGARGRVAVSMQGKIKTTVQMAAIVLLLWSGVHFGINLQRVGTWLIWLAAVLTLWSMVYYLRCAIGEVGRRGPGY